VRAFYVAGGTLPPAAPSYVARQSDLDLFEGLRNGAFCYVLDTRQMGKSSLMVRTAARLREAGYSVVVLDLTAIGSDVSASEWYFGLLTLMGEQLGIEDELEDHWAERRELSPVQRWMEALRKIALPHTGRPLVVFVDEIDAVRSLPFCADDFFNAIRECYNRRALDPALADLTFCLLGVASPSDLVQDARVTPFNIGRRIILYDFTAEEAAPLAVRLVPAQSTGAEPDTSTDPARAKRLLDRILYWTSGHPYMTQRLCQAISQADGPAEPEALVDAACAHLFTTYSGRHADDNLAFARDRLLNSGDDTTELLQLYARVRSGAAVQDDDTSPVCSALKLAGVARSENGHLVMRNRIYRRVFDQRWIAANMPQAEARRQRAAFWRGALRSGLVSAGVVLAIGYLLFVSIQSGRRMRIAEAAAHRQAAQMAAQADYASRLVYALNVSAAYEQYSTEGTKVAGDTLDAMKPAPGQRDLRGFEWYYLQRLCHAYTLDLVGHKQGVTSVAYSPDGKRLASASLDGWLRIWNAVTGAPLGMQHNHGQGGTSAAWAPDGKTIAWASTTGSTFIAPVDSRGRPGRSRVFYRIKGLANSVDFSPDGRLLVTADSRGDARLFSTGSWKEVRRLEAHAGRGFWTARFSPDGKTLATGGDDGVLRVWNVETGRQIYAVHGHSWYIYTLAFSPDGKHIVTGSGDATAIVWDAATGKQEAVLRGHTLYVYAVAWSRDGKTIATGSWDNTIRLWDSQTCTQRAVIENSDHVWALAFDPAALRLAVGSTDQTLRIWDVGRDVDAYRFRTGHSAVRSIRFTSAPDSFEAGSADGSERLYTGRGGRIFPAGIQPAAHGTPAQLRPLAISPDGSIEVEAAGGMAALLYNQKTGTRARIPLDAPAEHRTFCISPDNRTLAILTPPSQVMVCRTDQGQRWRLNAQPRSGGGLTNALEFSPDGRLVAVGGFGGEVQVWDYALGKMVVRLQGHVRAVQALAFTPDGRRILSGCEDGTARLWDLSTGRPLLTLSGNPGGVISAAFSPDGTRLITGCADGTLCLWDAPVLE
jgi:WD40 repeat protein